MCFLTQFDIRASRVQLAHGSFLHRNIASMGKKFNAFFQKKVFKLKYEDVHCKLKSKNLTLRYEKRVRLLAEQLKFKNGHSIFDANTECNYWLTAFKKMFKDIEIGGASFEEDAVDYAKRVFNDTKNSFGLISKEKETHSRVFPFVEGKLYDHAIVYGGLQENLNLPEQCSVVKELLQIVKPGGTMYIGDYVEKGTLCPNKSKYFIDAPSSCFWQEQCLQGLGVAEICYIKERDLFDDFSIDMCSIAVFIHKKVVISEQRGGLKDEHLDKQRCKPHPKMFYCNQSHLKPSSINQTIVTAMSGIPVRSISKAFEKYQEAKKINLK